MIKLFKFISAFLFLPACWAVTSFFYRIILQSPGGFKQYGVFIIGFMVYVVLFSIFEQPIKTYVFGHELTHAFWIILFKGKIQGFKVSGQGGSVSTNKSNFMISLAPYFFPFYSALVVLGYVILSIFWNMRPYYLLFVFFMGFTWAFHITMTVSVLRKGQPDIRNEGRFFSIVVIYIMNIFVLSLLGLFVNQYISVGTFFSGFYWSLIHAYNQCVRVIPVKIQEFSNILKSVSGGECP